MDGHTRSSVRWAVDLDGVAFDRDREGLVWMSMVSDWDVIQL